MRAFLKFNTVQRLLCNCSAVLYAGRTMW